MQKYIAYLRVSTKRQGRSGLGLESQKAIVEHFAKMNKAEIVEQFIEVESGKESTNRPVLKKAIEFCISNQHIMIVAKIDRLSRNVKHTFEIIEQLEYKLISCDIPNYPIDSLTLAIFSGLAMRERELISLRTKRALKAKKDRGEVIKRKPNPNLHLYRLERQNAIRERMKVYYTNELLVSVVEKYVKMDMTNLQIAEKLNSHLFRTRRGRKFNALSVFRLIRNIRKFYLIK